MSTNIEGQSVSPNDAKPRVVCRLYNSRNGDTEIYKEAVYTKLDGIYGYICVDGLTVKFFWVNADNCQVCCDHLTHFTVHYTLC